MNPPDELQVEVVYAAPDRQWVVSVRLAVGACVADALDAARTQLPEHLTIEKMGIFGTPCASDRVLANGDRVEVYRPLSIDAQTARRARAREQRFKAGLRKP